MKTSEILEAALCAQTYSRVEFEKQAFFAGLGRAWEGTKQNVGDMAQGASKAVGNLYNAGANAVGAFGNQLLADGTSLAAPIVATGKGIGGALDAAYNKGLSKMDDGFGQRFNQAMGGSAAKINDQLTARNTNLSKATNHLGQAAQGAGQAIQGAAPLAAGAVMGALAPGFALANGVYNAGNNAVQGIQNVAEQAGSDFRMGQEQARQAQAPASPAAQPTAVAQAPSATPAPYMPPQPAAPAATAQTTPDFNALFQRNHGTPFDPNSSMDRAKMQQLQQAQGNTLVAR